MHCEFEIFEIIVYYYDTMRMYTKIRGILGHKEQGQQEHEPKQNSEHHEKQGQESGQGIARRMGTEYIGSATSSNAFRDLKVLKVRDSDDTNTMCILHGHVTAEEVVDPKNDGLGRQLRRRKRIPFLYDTISGRNDTSTLGSGHCIA